MVVCKFSAKHDRTSTRRICGNERQWQSIPLLPRGNRWRTDDGSITHTGCYSLSLSLAPSILQQQRRHAARARYTMRKGIFPHCVHDGDVYVLSNLEDNGYHDYGSSWNTCMSTGGCRHSGLKLFKIINSIPNDLISFHPNQTLHKAGLNMFQ